MKKKRFDLSDPEVFFNYRFIQPPQIAYFVTTKDEFGNVNATPATLGTCNAANLPREGTPAEFYLTFSLSRKDIADEGNRHKARDGFVNLATDDEVVVSYIGKDLMRESIIANLPFPRGISELDVAGLSTFPSRHIDVPSIRECPVNIECRIEERIELGTYYMLYVAKVLGVSVDEELVEKDVDGRGIAHIDPLFEVNIAKTKKGDTRLQYGELDKSALYTEGDDFGSAGEWIGTFEHFIASEQERGKITPEEAEGIIRLQEAFAKDRADKTIKTELTARLRRLFER